MDEATFSLYAMDMRRAAERSACVAGCDSATAEDVASDTMLTLWMMRERLIPQTCVAYAGVAGWHKAINTFRHNTVRLDEDHQTHIALQSVEEAFIEQEDVEWLLKEIDTLPQTQQAILRMRQVEMLENDDIARRLGLTASSVATLLSRARKTMYNAIKQHMNK